MNTHLKLCISIGLIFITLSGLFAQKSKSESKADKMYHNFDYYKAIKKFNSCKQLTLDGKRKLADSYLKTNALEKSLTVYSDIIKSDLKIPADYYQYAQLLFKNASYDSGLVWMNKFKQLSPNDSRVKNSDLSISSIEKVLSDKGNFLVNTLTVNSNDDDFAATYFYDSVVFISNRHSLSSIRRIYNSNE